jgi:protein-tyrosine phosphatase
MVNNKTRLLFVCLGNIVRSPLAKALFDMYTSQSGLDRSYEADSAGTGGWHAGEGADSRMVSVAASHGLRFSHRARQIIRRDLDQFDLILGMDRENYNDLLTLARSPEQKAKIHLLREWDPLGRGLYSVPDPYYSGIDGFEEVYNLIDRCIRNLVSELAQKRHLGD